MNRQTHKAHISKKNTKQLTKNRLQAAAAKKKATGVKQPKPGVKVTALKKGKINQAQAEAGGLVKKAPAKLNAGGTTKDQKKAKKANPYTVKGNKKSKNDTETAGVHEVISSSSSPTYVQQSDHSKNKTRLSKPSAHIIQKSHAADSDKTQDEENFPDQAELQSEDERGMKEDNL